MPIHLTTPLTKEKIRQLRAGDSVLLSGTVYTARDAAHKRMHEQQCFPFPLQDQIIYYAGPTPTKPGGVIGSCGPTTSGRMDAYAPDLIAKGLAGMIGKGERSQQVIDAIKQFGAVYFGAIGGAGALIAKSVLASEVIAFEDLGTEAVRKLTFENLPLVVLVDGEGNQWNGSNFGKEG